MIQVVHLSPQLTSYAVSNPSVSFVSFTGSVAGGRSIAKTAATANGFTGVGLEVPSLILINYTILIFLKLGGKDPAYVRPDADLDYTAAQLVDGGSSCQPTIIEYNRHKRRLF